MGATVAASTADHLTECDACRRDFESLEVLPALLAEAVDPTITLKPDGALPIDRLLAAAAQIQSRRRRRFVLATAAAAVVLMALPAALLLGRGPDTPPTATTTQGTGMSTPDSVQRQVSNKSTGVEGKVTLKAATWGSDLTFALRGVPAGTQCTLVVVSADGRRESAARWQADYEGTAHVTGAVSTPLAEIDHIDVATQDGSVILSVPVS
jgi:hypothetical protein